MPSTPVATIDSTGIHAPDFDTVLSFFQNAYRTIYGADVVLSPDTQDGQWVALIALALHDANAMAVSAYNARSPATAQGAGLSSLVKLNNLTRGEPSRSSADLRIVGQVGTVITNGAVTDAAGQRWLLPSPVTIPIAGEITVTATAESDGAITAPAGTITDIDTPTPGWQSVSNAADAAVGLPIETDAALRRRREASTLLPGRTLLGGTVAALSALSGVARVRVYENDGDRTDTNTLPGHSIAAVVEGGDAYAIAGAIYARKGACGTYGTSTFDVGDAMQSPKRVAFSRPRDVPITYRIRLRALTGYDLTVQAEIQSQVAAWTLALGIGGGAGRALFVTRAYGPALLPGDTRAATFEVVDIAVARDGLAVAEQDIAFAFDEAPSCAVADVGVEVVP